MLSKLYEKFHLLTSDPKERGEYSAGVWQHQIRTAAFEACDIHKGTVAEIGCGEGLLIHTISQNKPELNVIGLDLWHDILKLARNRTQSCNNISLLQGDAVKLPLRDQSCDVVLCINVFFNLPNIATVNMALDEIVRVCKNNGKIIFDIRNRSNPLLRIKYGLARYYDRTVRSKNLPLKTYFLHQMIQALKDRGFTVKVTPTIWPRNRLSPIFLIEAQRQSHD